MAIAQVGNASNAFGASGTTPTFSGLSTTAGNIQVVFLTSGSSNDAAQVSAMQSGFSLVVGGQDGSHNGWFGAYISSSSLVAAPAFTLTTNHSWSGIAFALSGATGTVDASSMTKTNSGGTNPDTSTAITPTVSNDMLIAGFAIDSATQTVTTPPSGYTEVTPTGGANGSSFVTRAYYLLNPALSSQQPAMQWAATAPVAYYAAYMALTASAIAAGQIPYYNYQRASILAQ